MSVHRSKKGLDLPILGEPARGIEDHDAPHRVAVLGADYPGLRPTMHVKVGDDVRRGQLLIEDKKLPGVRFTSPGSGKVVAVHRGERRAFLSLVIELSSADKTGRVGAADQVSFSSFSGSHPNTLTRDDVRALLVESGQWTALRARPFSRVANAATMPHSIFVTAMDTNPLAPHVEDVLEGRQVDFERGLLAIATGAAALDTWRTALMATMGLPFDPASFLACFVHGALYYVPVLMVTLAVGGLWEALFAVVRRHEINEGFLVTWMLFPLILPPTVPLWQVALGITFGVVVGKEVFGGTGYNILNPALVARAFVFFAYPAQLSGDKVWITAAISTDGVSGATWLASAALEGQAAVDAGVTWWQAFVGLVPGSMGETSALACLAAAFLLVITGIGSWRIVASVAVGTIAAASLLNAVGSTTNPFFDVPFWWHFVLGGWAFGTVYMATDTTSTPMRNP